MRSYFVKRLLNIIPVIFIITFVVFALLHLSGDPTAMMLPIDASPEDRAILREALGLDKPFLQQYFIFVSNMLKGDFGTSFRYGQSAMKIVLERLPATLELASVSLVFVVLFSVPLGIWSAMAQNSVFDVLVTGMSVLGRAMPSFWLGIMLILFFAVQHPIFPVSGRGGALHLVLPSACLAVSMIATLAPLIRSSMLDILQKDFIRTARSKGLKEYVVIYKHGLRNALIPFVTMLALQIPVLIGGAIITETVFSWPGLGQLVIQALYGRDIAIVEAAIFIIALMTIISNFIADLLYSLIDPRIKYR